MSKKKILIGIFVGVITLLGIDVFVIEPNMIEINEIKISDTRTQMKIGLIADFQRGSSDSSFVQRVVDIMNEQDLDVILIAGDFIDKNPDELLSVEPLKKLKTKYGVYGVLGNHDYDVYFLNRNNVNLELGDKVKEFLERDGTIRILKNESVMIENISIIGLDSYWAGLRDVDKAIMDTSNEFKILFSHNQNNLEINPETADVYLFGHTHCGQIRLPYVGSIPKIIGFEGDYDYRHYAVNDTDVYTTCGLTPGPRLFNPPEITIINLL
ncbi:MAG: metallophosphoesterase [Nitrosopumilus sp.]